MSDERVCHGCGAILQTEQPDKAGYLPVEKLGEEAPLCRRCYRIVHYGEALPVEILPKNYWDELNKMLRFAKAVVYVVDIGDFEGSWSNKFVETCREHNLVLAVNKIDVLPYKISESEIRDWLSKRLGNRLRAFNALFFVSAKNGQGVEEIRDFLVERVKKGNVIFAGATNVGKSSLLNKLVQGLGKGKGILPITESKFPGTTLRRLLVSIPHSKLNIWDSPGVPVEGRTGDYLCSSCASTLLFSSEISRKTFKLQEGQSIMFGGLGIFTVVKGENRPIFQCFASRDVYLHQTTADKFMEILSKHGSNWLTPPCKNCLSLLWEGMGWKREVFTVNEGEDLVISGLGWVSVRRGPAQIEAIVPKKIRLIQRPALVAPKEE